mmetsp:Transcript_26742/g.62816  ORF Transcript_26742/g.62816 Transcript_26742/m.62816 type:complete len:221 (-) Transcript_26742:91-753(-)|eukprot:CAMPEP_0197187338 /NCGR_PEP_ID=MMETSP1423-20130617/15733_1 /TAXON_ID=476441 /ORGANISM="Pseudo-nitzschia heimii, Strain UNC1101" /LENGTH=220 /DNA_ID=CAMNT_0042638895 /DNA_START=608 /DNA_END=1270 /DNA_ORIENTATION=+
MAPPPGPVFRNTDEMTRRILTETRTVAVLGASDKPHRDSYEITKLWIDRGYDVVPVNPNLSGLAIHGREVVASLEEIPEGVRIDLLVDVFRNSRHARDAVESAIAVGARSIWFQEGVVDHAAAVLARRHGLDVAMDVCPYHELPRLGIDGPDTDANANRRSVDDAATEPSPSATTAASDTEIAPERVSEKATRAHTDARATTGSDRIEKRRRKRRKRQKV